MPAIHRRKIWDVDRAYITPESVYFNRRQFLKSVGAGGIGLALPGCVLDPNAMPLTREEELAASLLPIPGSAFTAGMRSDKYVLDRPVTDENVSASFVNFYEFGFDGNNSWRDAQMLETRPWEMEVTGLVANPVTLDIDDLIRMMPVEERLYRHRCVEAWAMAVPWSGFPFSALMNLVEPLSSATFVRFLTFYNPEVARNQQSTAFFDWPYSEGLTIDEAANELCFGVTGSYGHDLPKQHGGPLRIVVPWKYGYKSAKSIVRIEFTDQQPPTFWNTYADDIYGFTANVNPDRPHRYWSQTHEEMLGTEERIETMLYNGYGDFVAHMYTGNEF